MIMAWYKGREMFINAFKLMRHKSNYGVPCGTIGSGGIGRDFRGGFCKFSLRPGRVEQHVECIKANQFLLTVHDSGNGNLLYQKVLTGVNFNKKPLREWDFTFPPKQIAYRGLFPRSWTEFSVPELDLILVCRQISPVIPHNYQDSNLPVTSFVWTVQNKSDCAYRISITFTWRNGTGDKRWNTEGICNARTMNGSIGAGATLMHRIDYMSCVYAISTKKQSNSTISTGEFDPNSNGSEIWSALGTGRGQLNNDVGNRDQLSKELAVAVSNQTILDGGTETEMEFALVWHMPLVQFGRKQRVYRRRYAKFFGIEPSTAIQIAEYAMKSRSDWEEQIAEWQNPVLNDSNLPESYKSALFNELYYLVDGGSFWFDFDDEWLKLEKNLSEESIEHFKEYGRFGYVESWEYHMINTYDVHFYAAFAWLTNWPMLELSIQLDFNDQIMVIDDRLALSIGESVLMRVKYAGRVPHDLGHPGDEPFLEINGYQLHDTSRWKDLNLKFVISVYRDCIHAVEDKQRTIAFMDHFYPAVRRIMLTALEEWDVDGDSMIENSGFPDQTYDIWVMTGTSAYCGSLWLAALQSAIRLASRLNYDEDAERFSNALISAWKAFEKKLWTGSYFRFDERSPSRETIMADQLCGFWHLAAIDGADISENFDREKILKALDTIYEFNVQNYANGQMGAVNGARPDKTIDLSCTQSEEMWIGTSYALASFLLQQGRSKQAFQIVDGIYRSCWIRAGLQYQTPEAFYQNSTYRAIGYMRPLAIWAIEWNRKRVSSRINEK